MTQNTQAARADFQLVIPLFYEITDEQDFIYTFIQAAHEENLQINVLIPAYHSTRSSTQSIIKSISNNITIKPLTIVALTQIITTIAQQRQSTVIVLPQDELDQAYKFHLSVLFKYLQSASGGRIARVCDINDIPNFATLSDVASLSPMLAGGVFTMDDTEKQNLFQIVTESAQGCEPALEAEFYELFLRTVPPLALQYRAFIQLHKSQLNTIRLPRGLWKHVFDKLQNANFDFSDTFDLSLPADVKSNHVHSSASGLVAVVNKSQTVPKHQGVWILEHSIDVKTKELSTKLQEDPDLVSRLSRLLDVSGDEPPKPTSSDSEHDLSEDAAAGLDLLESQTQLPRDILLPVFLEADCDTIEALTLVESRIEELKKKASASASQQASSSSDVVPVKALTREERIVQGINSRFWQHAGFYRVLDRSATEPKIETMWYLNEELGCALVRTDKIELVNCICVPFVILSIPSNPTFNLIWLCEDVKPGQPLVVDISNKSLQPPHDKAYLFARTHAPAFLPSLQSAYTSHASTLHKLAQVRASLITDAASITLPPPKPPKHLTAAVKGADADASDESSSSQSSSSAVSTPTLLKVFTDLAVLKDVLDPNMFIVVDKKEDADIWWFAHADFKDWASLPPNVYISKFPQEANLTYKHFLHACTERFWGYPYWKPTTYNSKTQLAQFTGDFIQRQHNRLDTTYITKSTNSTHSLGHLVLNSLEEIVRVAETEPVVIQKYLERPLLFNKRKFDLRFIVLLKSAQPLELYVFNTFWIRLANKEFEMTEFDAYEKHFTVMNYTAGATLTQIWYHDFLQKLQAQHPDLDVFLIQKRIYAMIKDIFIAATSQPSPDGLDAHPMSRAMYGIDVMVRDDGVPVLLEVNFSPDCKRAVNYHPGFFNQVFSTLFHERPNDEASLMVTRLA